jgi:hypothetical protein
MRLTIIPADSFVAINGEGYGGLDLSFMPVDIHAVQWYETEGEIEYKDSRGRVTRNEVIDNIDKFQPALMAWQSAKEAMNQVISEQIG